jgi:repressor LexA
MGRTPPGATREKVLAFVRDRILAGSPPTIREVQEAFDFRSVQTAREHLEGLVAAGRLTKDPGKSRGYRFPAGLGASPVLVPLLGRVPAGPFDLAVEDPDGYLLVQTRHPAGELFGLRVRGESMLGAGILPGDVVIVRRQATAKSGDIVVARVGEEATVKRLRIRRGEVELHPENPSMEPIVPDPRDLTLLGKVVEVRRELERS